MPERPSKRPAKRPSAPVQRMTVIDQRFLDSSINEYKRVAKSGTTNERLAASINLSRTLNGLVSEGKISQERARRIASRLGLKVAKK